MSDSSFTVNALIGLSSGLSLCCWRSNLLKSVGIPSYFLPPSSKQEEKGFEVPWQNQKENTHTHKQCENKMADLILDSMSKWRWGNITFATFVFCPIYHIMRFLKKLGSLRAAKQKAVKLMSTFGFLFQVTCLSVYRRLRLEASVGELCFWCGFGFLLQREKNSSDKVSSQSSVSSAKDNFEL